jgi:hypothetical protein
MEETPAVANDHDVCDDGSSNYLGTARTRRLARLSIESLQNTLGRLDCRPAGSGEFGTGYVRFAESFADATAFCEYDRGSRPRPVPANSAGKDHQCD